MLKSHRVVVCAGSGGVGKTTVAAALGVRASQLGLKALVLTVDPARRLATALGLDLTGASEKPVQGLSGEGSRDTGRLSAAVIDSKKIFDQFIREHGRQTDIERIMRNRLYQQLSTTLSGSQEFTALERLLQAVESGQFDVVILDTPPTKHAMDFLRAPQRINALFQEAVTRWFLDPSEKATGLFANLIGRGTRAAFQSLENLTGAKFIEELVDFFAAIRAIQTELRERSERVHALLVGQQTGFVVVTSFDAAKLLEAQFLQGELERLGYHLRSVIINRAFPIGVPDDSAAPRGQIDEEAYGKVRKFYKEFKDYHAFRYNLYQDFARGLGDEIVVMRVPEYRRDIHGLRDLEDLARTLGEGGK